MGTLYGVLGLYGLLVIATIAIQSLAAIAQLGLPRLAGNREAMPPLTGAACRLDRAMRNSLAAMALFAPAVIALQTTAPASAPILGSALVAAQVFLSARALYLLAFWAGIPWVRGIAWTVGFLATLALWLCALPFGFIFFPL